jgi:hypothetical protein
MSEAKSESRFAEARLVIVYIPSPIEGQQALPYKAMERRIGPITHARYQPMLHRIEVDVIKVPGEVRFAPNCMFPKSPLPQRIFTVRTTNKWNTGRYGGLVKSRFDVAPTARKVRVSVRQREDRMKMIGQHNNRINYEWALPPDLTKRRT